MRFKAIIRQRRGDKKSARADDQASEVYEFQLRCRKYFY